MSFSQGRIQALALSTGRSWHNQILQSCRCNIGVLRSTNNGSLEPFGVRRSIGQISRGRSFWRIPQLQLQKQRALFSSSSTETAEDVSECARHLVAVGKRMGGENGDGDMIAAEVAKRLSPAARQELSRVKEEVFAASPPVQAVVREPSWSDLKLVALAQGVPFIGFGIMDNAILIIAGDAIDHSLGVVLGISTMCAAAIGNIVSDVAGVMLGTVVEDFCARFGLPKPSLSSAQRQLRSVRFAGQFGICVGLVIGCIIGMFPLLFIDSEHIQKLKQDASINNMFTDIVTEARGLIGAGHTCLFLVVDNETSTAPLLGVGANQKSPSVDDNGYLYGQYINDKTGKRNSIRIPLGRGLVSRAALSGEAVNVYDAKVEPDWATDIDEPDYVPNHDIRHMACMPVFDQQGRVIAIIQAINKVDTGSASADGEKTKSTIVRKGQGFTPKDMQVLQALASHVSVSLQNMHSKDSTMSLRDTIQILKEHGTDALGHDHGSAGQPRIRNLYPEVELA